MNILGGLFLLAVSLYLPGANSSALTLKAAIEQAKDYSPDLKALRFQYASARAKSWQAIAPADPTFSISYNDTQHALHTENPASTVYQITQPLSFPGKAFVSRAALRANAEALEAQIRALELQINTNVSTAYWQFSQIRQNIELNEEQRHSYQRILEIAKRRYATGSIPQVDLLNAEVAVYSSVNDLNDLKASERSAQAQLNLLLGQDINTVVELQPFQASRYPIPMQSEAERKMVENRQELRAARAQLRTAEHNYSLSKMSLLPDFQLTAGMTHYNVPSASPLNVVAPNVTNTYMVGAQVTIPLWFIFNETQSIRAAANDRAAAEASLQSAYNQSRLNLTSTFENLKSALARMDNFEHHLLPLSEQALSIALTNYSAGKIDFQTLVDTAASRRNIRRDYLAAMVNYQTLYANLEQLMGEELQDAQ